MRHLFTGPHDVQLPLAIDWCSWMASSSQSEDRGYPQGSRLALLVCGVFIMYPSSPLADARRRTKIIAKRSLPPDAACRRH